MIKMDGPLIPNRRAALRIINRLPTPDELRNADENRIMIYNVFDLPSLLAVGLKPGMTCDDTQTAVIAAGLWPSMHHAIYVAPDWASPELVAIGLEECDNRAADNWMADGIDFAGIANVEKMTTKP